MKKWSVVGKVVGSKYLGDFEAETAEEAVEKALESDAAQVGMCHECFPECEDGQIEEATAEEVKP